MAGTLQERGYRDAVEVNAEQVAVAEQAVAAAMSTAAAQQAQAGAWVAAGLPDGTVVSPGPADAPRS
jgi:hypothetical protein